MEISINACREEAGYSGFTFIDTKCTPLFYYALVLAWIFSLFIIFFSTPVFLILYLSYKRVEKK